MAGGKWQLKSPNQVTVTYKQELIKLFRNCLYLLLGLITSWIVQGCNLLRTGPTPTPTPNLSAEEIVNRSSQAMLAINTLHFTIDLTGSLDYIDRPPTTALKHVDGDLFRPDKVRGLVKVSSLGIVTEIGLISIKGQSYVTNPLNQRWEILPPEWGWYFIRGQQKGRPRLHLYQWICQPAQSSV